MRIDRRDVTGRMRLLFSGDAGVGKTFQMFQLIKHILLTTEKQVFYMDCDTGALRFVQKLYEDSDLTEIQKDRFFYYTTPNWIELRDAYREIRQLWAKRDCVFVDRVDMSWDFIQHYYNSSVLQLDEQELDDYYLASRLTKRTKSGDKKDMGPQNEIGGTDWDSVKNSYNSVVYDLFNGPGPSRMEINVCMSTLAESKDHSYNPSGKPDARVLDRFSVVVRGERSITSLPDTHLFLSRSPLGRVVNTIKDRERKEISNAPVSDNLLELYETTTGEKLIL